MGFQPVYRVDPTSGAPTLIGNLAGAAAVQGLACVPDPSAPCPGDLDVDKMVGPAGGAAISSEKA